MPQRRCGSPTRCSSNPLRLDELDQLAATIGADVPFFLRDGPQLGTGDGTTLEPLELPQDFWVVLVLPHGETKASTAAVYRRFDERGGEAGFAERAAALADALAGVRTSARPCRSASERPRHFTAG